MTLREKVIVSAYTGYLMCDFPHVHKYIEEKVGRPVFTHEMRASNTLFLDEFHKRVRPDFLALCESGEDDETKRIKREHGEMRQAVLDFCNAFTMVYPPNDKDCPALLAGAFELLKEHVGIETVDLTKEEKQ